MKLNFLNVLNGKASHEEIAEQIVALEIKQKECERDRDLSKILCKEVRGKVMCGERISPDVIRNADKAYEESLLDLEIVRDSIEELRKKLVVALEEHRQNEERRLNELRRKVEQEREKAMRELAKAKGRLLGMAFGIHGHPGVAQRSLGDSRSFIYTSMDQFHEEFDAEYKKAVAELKRPTFADIDDERQQRERWLYAFNSEEEFNQVIKKYRDQQGVAALEAEVVGV